MLRLALMLMLLPAVALADVSGPARVIDGDTIEVAGERVRLHGIDAPESGQSCLRHGVAWQCGAEASQALRELVRNRPVRCDERGRDRYRRLISVCWANGVDLNGRMVALGMALAYRRYSTAYVHQEARAKAARAGMWAGPFIPPWNWRLGIRLPLARRR